jgi:hypothetical protein
MLYQYIKLRKLKKVTWKFYSPFLPEEEVSLEDVFTEPDYPQYEELEARLWNDSGRPMLQPVKTSQQHVGKS